MATGKTELPRGESGGQTNLDLNNLIEKKISGERVSVSNLTYDNKE